MRKAGCTNKFPEAYVLLVPGFPSNEKETNCLPFLQDFVLSFKKQYPDKNLFLISFQYPVKAGKYVWNNTEVYSAGGKNRKGILRIISWIKVIYYYLKLRKNHKISGIISFWLTECTLVGQFLAKLEKIKLLAYILGQDSQKNNPYLKYINLKKINVISISEKANLALLEATGNVARAVVNMGINPAKFEMQKRNFKDALREIDIIGVGSFIQLKNYDSFIKIIAELIKDFPEIKVVIIGDGPDKNKLLKLCAELNVSENIQFTGALSHEETIKFLYKSKVFLHTSLAEGQAAVFSEALYCGLNVVCFDVGRITEDCYKMHVCKSEKEMVEKMEILLSSELNFDPVLLRTIDDTVNDCISYIK